MEKQDKAEMAFKLYDKDKDGYITKAEMTKLSKTLTKDQIDKVYTAMKISFTDSQKGNCVALSTNLYIRVSVSDLYSHRIGPHTVFSCSRKADRLWEYIKNTHRRIDVEIVTEAVQSLFWEYLFRILGIVSLQCRETTE